MEPSPKNPMRQTQDRFPNMDWTEDMWKAKEMIGGIGQINC